MNERSSIHFINEAINQGAELRNCIYCSPCIMNIGETTEQFLPPVNILNNSQGISDWLLICSSHSQISGFLFSLELYQTNWSSLLQLTIYIPKYWMKIPCGLRKFFFRLDPLKFLSTRSLSGTLGSQTPPCATSLIPCPITLTERAQQPLLLLMNNFGAELLTHSSGSFTLMTFLCQADKMGAQELPLPVLPAQHFPQEQEPKGTVLKCYTWTIWNFKHKPH